MFSNLTVLHQGQVLIALAFPSPVSGTGVLKAEAEKAHRKFAFSALFSIKSLAHTLTDPHLEYDALYSWGPILEIFLFLHSYPLFPYSTPDELWLS